VVIEASLC